MLWVVAGMVMADGRVLLARAPAGHALAGWWEFPGGKIEAGESPCRALARELHEELAISAGIGPFVARSEHRSSGRLIRLDAYLASLQAGVPIPRQHAELAWAAPACVDAATLAPADRSLLVALRRQLDDDPRVGSGRHAHRGGRRAADGGHP